MTRVYWDSMVFIYMFEAHPVYGRRVGEIFDRMLERGDRVCASVFTACEVLVGPYRQRANHEAEKIKRYFGSSVPEMLPVPLRLAGQYAELRARHGLSVGDALHLAIAAEGRVDLFLTSDRRLHRLTVPGIGYIAGLGTDVY